MNRKIIEYAIIAVVAVLLIYTLLPVINYTYSATEVNMGSDMFYVPSSSEYNVVGDTIEFKNPYDFYNLNVTKLNSSDERVQSLLKYYSNFDKGTKDFYNETSYLITVDYEENGFSCHAMVIPMDSFDKDNLTFKKDTQVWLFEGNNRDFVVDTVFNSMVVL